MGDGSLSPGKLERAQRAIRFLSSLPIVDNSQDGSNTSGSGSSSCSGSSLRSSSSSLRSGSNSGLIERCNEALASVRRSQQQPVHRRPSSVREEMLTNLQGGCKKKKWKRKKNTWKHKFVCLAYVEQEMPLREAEKDELFSAGLGEKEIELDLDMDAEEFRQCILKEYPQLKSGGGYQFLKCVPNTRHLEPLSGLVMQSPSLLKQRVGSARTYIRPLQRSLDTTPVKHVDEIADKCFKCLQKFPLSQLCQHLESCSGCYGSDDSDDDVLIELPWRRGKEQTRRENEGQDRRDSKHQDRSENEGQDRRENVGRDRRENAGRDRRENEGRDRRENAGQDRRENAGQHRRENEEQTGRQNEEDTMLMSGDFQGRQNRSQSDSHSAVIDLSVDELETEESILLYARHNSIENVGSPVAPPFSPVTQISPDFNSIESILTHLSSSLSDDLSIDVRRSHLLKDALKESRKKKFDPMKNLSVTFVGESAIDYGGPRREFFRLFIDEVVKSDYMYGGMFKFFTADVSAIQAGDFKAIGSYVGMSIAQGGPGFPGLASAVYDYLTTGKTTNIQVSSEDLPIQLKTIVNQLKSANSDEQIQAVFEDTENQILLLETGCHMLLSSLKVRDREYLIALLLDYHCIIKPKAAIDQFIEGLQCSGIMHYVKCYPDVMKPLFCKKKEQLTTAILKALFSTSFSDGPSRTKEEEAYIFFVDFLDSCEAGESVCKLKDVLIFSTGADQLPPLGFHKKIDLVFLGVNEPLPTASTCGLIMRIPTCHETGDLFKEKMELGLKGGLIFGNV